MLWPETRDRDTLLKDKIPGKIDRTTGPTYLRVPTGYLPGAIRPFVGIAASLMPFLFSADESQKGIVLGPFPSGMPIELLANLQMSVDNGGFGDAIRLNKDVLTAVLKLSSALRAARGKSDSEAQKIVFSPDVVEALMKVSKCPDFIINRGHYFGAEGIEGEAPLSNTEKAALISYLKTF
jgi:hypothetical protein